MTQPDRTLSSRFELKYWLHPRLVPALRRGIRPFVQPDRHAAIREGFRYTICSLYLDSPALDLYRTTIEGHRNRYKLRIRTYTDRPEDPVFFEIKKRADRVIRKRRCMVSRDIAGAFLRGQLPESGPGLEHLEEFRHAVVRIGARPVVRVRYQREAYESCGRDPLRITMDTDLAHAVTLDGNLEISGPDWVESPTEGVILEIKYTDTCPDWVLALVRSLGIERNSVPKYILSVKRAREMHGPAFLAAHPMSKSIV